MNKNLLCLFLLLSSFALAQSKQDGRAAFQRLLAAHDSEIVDSVKSNDFVCFADENPNWLASDRFLVVKISEPVEGSWTNADDSGSGTIYGTKPAFAKQWAAESVYVWEHEDNQLWIDSLLGGEWRAYGYYGFEGGKRKWIYGPVGGNPVFGYSKKDEAGKTLESINVDNTTFSASKIYANKA